MAKGGRCLRQQEVEVREMRNAETILAVIRERGAKGLPLERVYRLLFNADLYLRAYGHIAGNRGVMTPGATDETADGMSQAKIGQSLTPCVMTAFGGRRCGACTSRRSSKTTNA